MRSSVLVVMSLALLLLSSCSNQSHRRDSARLENSLSDVRNFQAEQTAQISSLQQQIHRLTGRLDELEYYLKRRGQMAEGAGSPEASSVAPSVPGADGSSATSAVVPGSKALPPSIVPLAPLEDDEKFARSLPANASRNLSHALAKIREGSFRDSLTILQELVQAGERAEWTPNVLFWLGVTYDGLREDKNALRSYNDLIVQFPKHRRVPLALYREADVLKRLGDNKSASLLLRKLLNEFPDTSEGARAREDLKKF